MKKLLLTLIILSLASCKEENEDVVKQPSKDGSIEVSLKTKHEKDHDILTSVYKVWVKGKLDKTFTTIDTLKTLGTTRETINEDEQDDAGNSLAKQVEIPRDYELFITVK